MTVSLNSSLRKLLVSCHLKGKPLGHTAPLFLKECQMTADQVKRVEIETRGQSANAFWHQQRIGRVTASNFHTYYTKAQFILNRKGQNLKTTSVQFTCIQPVERKWCFSPTTDKVGNCPWRGCHKSFYVRCCFPTWWWSTGFQAMRTVHKTDYLYLAASPDGLFLYKCCGLSIVDAKCPYTVRNENIHLKDTFDRVKFVEDFLGKPAWNGPTNIISKCKHKRGFVVFVVGFSLFGDRVAPFTMSELNLTWNFVSMLWTILHCFTSHLYCHACRGTGTSLIAQSAIKWF